MLNPLYLMKVINAGADDGDIGDIDDLILSSNA